MARFDIFSIMVVLALAISPGLARKIVDEGIEPAYEGIEPAYAYDSAPSPLIDLTPYIEEFKFLVQCAKKLTGKCGEQVYISIFRDGADVSDECCTKLVLMGQRCHNGLVKTILERPDLNLNASHVLPRSAQTWNKCVAVAQAVSPSPSSED